mgnify:FL=1
MSFKNIFITGTNTGVGKTVITGLLAKALLKRKKNIITQKWIQTGNTIPEDIYTHLEIMNLTPNDISDYATEMCPYIYTLPASPHLAAINENKPIQKHRILLAYHALSNIFDHVLVEGAGGFLVPYSESGTIGDIVEELKLDIILVVNNTLGCINHTLLSVNEIRSRGLNILGLIFNQSENEPQSPILEDNPLIVSEMTELPILANLTYKQDYKKINLSSVFDKLL